MQDRVRDLSQSCLQDKRVHAGGLRWATTAVDAFFVPSGCRREGARRAFFLCSLGGYCVRADAHEITGVFHCLPSQIKCRSRKCAVPCAIKKRTDVNLPFRETPRTPRRRGRAAAFNIIPALMPLGCSVVRVGPHQAKH